MRQESDVPTPSGSAPRDDIGSPLDSAPSADPVDPADPLLDRTTASNRAPVPPVARNAQTEPVRDLQAERARFDAVVARSGDLVMLFDVDGTITWVGPSSYALFGIHPADLIGMNAIDLIHAEDRERVVADLFRIPHAGDHVRTEYRVTGPDGEVRWVEEIVTNLLDELSVTSIVGNIRDVTTHKFALEAVEFQARLLAAAGQAIVSVGSDNTVLYWNAAAHRMYGWTAEEAIGADVRYLVSPTEGWDPQLAAMARAGDGQDWTGEVTVRTKDGRTIPALVTNTALYDDDGVHIASVSVSSDISERLRNEAAAAQLSAIVESSYDAIFSTDLDGNLTSWNPAAARMFGYETPDVVGKHIRMLVPPDKEAELDAVLERVIAGQSVSDDATVGRRSDSTVVDLSATMSPVHDRTGAVIGASTIARDISERIETERRIDGDRRRLAEAQSSAELGSFEIDLATNTITLSDEFWRIIGKKPRREPFQDFSFVHPDDLAQIEEALGRVIQGQSAVDCTHRIVRPTGEVRWVVTRTSPVRDPSDHFIGGTMLDITDRREAELATERLAFFDPLTGLANRLNITNRLDQQLVASAADGQQIAVALIDLDQFKVINDSLSHSAGDSVLAAVARRIEASLEPDEVLARFGGDEFAVVRGGVAGLDDCTDLGSRLIGALDAPITVERRDFYLSMSVGVALSDADDSADSMFRKADTAMYHAKDTGRDRMALYDDALQADSRRRLDLREALQTALELGELSVVYQPVIELATMRTSGFEALVRWTSPSFGPVRPAEFIPIAEETGLILAIGEWVLDEALARVSEWRREAATGDEPWVAVNLSARQTESIGLADRVTSALRRADVPAEALHLELTESILMATIGSSIATLHQLNDLGIKLSIDDFGTGYSSLSYLKRLPISTLKIDKSFVDGLGAEAEDSSIVRAITSLARTLGLDVLAEGVETHTQLEALIDLGCNYGQGFLWSPGVPAADAATWIDT